MTEAQNTSSGQAVELSTHPARRQPRPRRPDSAVAGHGTLSLSPSPRPAAVRSRQGMPGKPKLRAYWSKRERDVMLDYPLGRGTSCDGGWLASILDRKFTDELRARGYKPETLRFSVEVDLEGPRAAEKFPTLVQLAPAAPPPGRDGMAGTGVIA